MTHGKKTGNQANPVERELSALKERLLALHKALIDSERVEYEKAFGKVESANRFLELLISDPWFAWLHPLSLLAVAIDEHVDGKAPARAEDLLAMQMQARELLKVSEEGHGFGSNYFVALQRDPDVIFAHAEVMKVLGAGAEPAKT